MWLVVRAALAGTCEPLSSADLAAGLDEFDRRLAAGDPDLAAVALRLHASLPCLDRIARPSEIARLAHDLAIVRFLDQDEDEAVRWAHAAEAALPGYPWPPSIGPDHLLRGMLARAAEPGWEGPADKVLAPPKDAAVLVNGRWPDKPEARADVPTLVQIVGRSGPIDGWWQDGGSFPAAILGTGAPPKRPSWLPADEDPAGVARAAEPLPIVIAFVGGVGVAGQRSGVALDDPAYVPTRGAAGLAAAVASTGHLTIAGPVGAFWDVVAGANPAGPDGGAFAGVSIGEGPVVDVGGGVATATLVVGDDPQRFVVPQVRLGGGVAVPVGANLLDLGVALGGSPAGAHVRARIGLARGGEGLGWYGGIEVADDVAWFVQEGVERDIAASGLRVGGRIGLSL